MKNARNEIEARQEMSYALPPMPPEERAEYDRGPSPLPAAIAVLAALVLGVVAIYAFA